MIHSGAILGASISQGRNTSSRTITTPRCRRGPVAGCSGPFIPLRSGPRCAIPIRIILLRSRDLLQFNGFNLHTTH